MLFDHLERAKQKRIEDKMRYYKLDEDRCQMCSDIGDDRRSLMLRCLYDISEVVPEAIDTFDVAIDFNGYYIRICKACRGRFLGKLEEWRAECFEVRDRREQEPMGEATQ